MRITEIYKSIQGEGFLMGTESIFVRASGCNLRCWYCDTPYASWEPEGEDLSVEEILRQISRYDCDHVILTGGEPMLYSEMIPLCARLCAERLHITIETAGTLFLPLDCDLMSISPKLSNSAPPREQNPRWHRRHQQTRHAPQVIRRLVNRYAYQFKFVVASRRDCDEVEAYLAEFPEIARAQVMLMPQGTDTATLEQTARWLEPLCVERRLKFCPRKHIEMFGLARGT